MEKKENRRKGYRLTIPEKEEVKNYISELYTKGYSYTAMAKWITEQGGIAISRSSLIPYVKEVLKEWHDNRVEDIDLRITIELAKLDSIECEAWQAWRLSKQDYRKTGIKHKGVPVSGSSSANNSSSDSNSSSNSTTRIKPIEITEYEETETSYGDPRFMEIVLKCVNTRMSLLAKGYFEKDKPQEYINRTNNGVQVVIQAAERPPCLPKKMQEMLDKEKSDRQNGDNSLNC